MSSNQESESQELAHRESDDNTLTAAVGNALAQTNTKLPLFNTHTTHADKVAELEGNRLAAVIVEIDAKLAALLAERNNAVVALERITGQKVG